MLTKGDIKRYKSGKWSTVNLQTWQMNSVIFWEEKWESGERK